jgi:DNA-binding MarR family transcriptional regulator
MDLAQWPTNRLLNTAARLTENTSTDLFRSLDITPAGIAILRVLSQELASSQSELEQKLRVRPETLAKLVDRLQHDGLIVQSGRARDPGNVQLRITQEGRKLLDRADAIEEERERTLGSDEQLRAALISRIRALGLDTDADQKRTPLKLVPKISTEDDDGSRSSATG